LIIDQKKLELLPQKFTSDAVFHYPSPIGTIQGTTVFAKMLLILNGVTTYHSLGTHITELVSAKTATASTYCIGIHMRAGDKAGQPMMILGHYED
jgi:hypothetical protein